MRFEHSNLHTIPPLRLRLLRLWDRRRRDFERRRRDWERRRDWRRDLERRRDFERRRERRLLLCFMLFLLEVYITHNN